MEEREGKIRNTYIFHHRLEGSPPFQPLPEPPRLLLHAHQVRMQTLPGGVQGGGRTFAARFRTISKKTLTSTHEIWSVQARMYSFRIHFNMQLDTSFLVAFE